MSDIKVCRWPDWNRGLLASEATALPTEPQPLPNIKQLIKCTSSKQHSEGILWIRNDVKLSEHQQIQTLGCHHSSLDLSAPTILLPRVRVPSSSSTLLSFIVFVLYLLCEKNKNKQKEARFGTFLKKSFFSVLRESNLDESERRSTSHQIHIYLLI